MDLNAESRLRQQIFKHLRDMTQESVTVTREQLWSFDVDGEVYRLIDRSRGIRNPKEMNGTLSIMSDPDSGYEDEELGGSLFAYSYRAGSDASDNTKLRRAIELKLPLILLRKILPGLYYPVFPVYAVDDDRENQRFLIALDEELRSVKNPRQLEPVEKRYAERITKQRIHQPEFRERILLAYQRQCAVCNLKHRELLDAAHIIADTQPHGTATVDNGLSLCKIHHAAYDANFLGISPDFEVKINKDLLEEKDGPMLEHGIQAMHDRPLVIPAKPTDHPSRSRLDERYTEFLAAS
ncbi:restriction endonuclease [Nocardia speluncae]|uniref:Restriction endonuclease n=1 Tax=Nocardia speluncae TaxID=419477 RepID=A0A846XNQ9_9NOCA|nr:HNH endonuclease [Nocardia speluncae]NKY35334.1 restriction endonuclease [Nocardia speluncae]